jgi:hypothetical protein
VTLHSLNVMEGAKAGVQGKQPDGQRRSDDARGLGGVAPETVLLGEGPSRRAFLLQEE